MSLMNDALRKKKNENKHPSGTDIFKDDSERKTKHRFRIYGIAAIVLLVCAVAGFYLYEMISLSQPISPALQSPLASEPHVSPAERPVSSGRDSSVPAPSETALPAERLPEKQVIPSKDSVMEPVSPALEPEVPKAVPATARLKTAPQPAPEKMHKPTRPEKPVPPPVIEPEEIRPQPVSAGDTHLNQAEKTITRIDTETAPAEELFYHKGLSYHRQNKIEMAIQMYQAVLKRNPDHRSTRFNLAAAYIQAAAYTEARSILLGLKREEPENPEILLNLAVVEIGLERPEEALAFLDNAEKRAAAPTFDILFHKGTAHSRMGDFEKALGMYRKAERLAPGNPRLRLNTAIAYDNLAQYDQAISHYQFVLGGNLSLTTTERREIEARVRELNAYLAQKTARPATKPQTDAGQGE
jgi:Flp pilus assembly protein TadD